MPDRGKIMSQTYYEKQNKLIELYKESFIRKEMTPNEVITSLRMIGFSEKMAANRICKWSVLFNTSETETDKAKKQRLKQQASLEKYIHRMRLWRKNYKEYTQLRLNYTNNEISKDEAVSKFIQLGYNLNFAEHTIGKWDLKLW